jgi:hypothetical protein
MSYIINISESQRQALLHLIKTSTDRLDFIGEDKPLEYWEDMLSDLPKQEAEHPGVIHGFCY